MTARLTQGWLLTVPGCYATPTAAVPCQATSTKRATTDNTTDAQPNTHSSSVRRGFRSELPVSPTTIEKRTPGAIR